MKTSCARSSACSRFPTMRYRKLISGLLYRWSRSANDCSSPAFTSSISWTSDLAIAATLYQTHVVSESCKWQGYSKAKVRRNYTWNKCCIINKLTTPTNTSSAIRQFGSRFTSGSKSVAATYNVTPPESGNAYLNCPCRALVSSTPKSVATPNNPAARIALRFPCPLASTTDATVNPSGSLCRNTATKITAPSHVETKKPAAIATPSKNV